MTLYPYHFLRTILSSTILSGHRAHKPPARGFVWTWFIKIRLRYEARDSTGPGVRTPEGRDVRDVNEGYMQTRKRLFASRRLSSDVLNADRLNTLPEAFIARSIYMRGAGPYLGGRKTGRTEAGRRKGRAKNLPCIWAEGNLPNATDSNWDQILCIVAAFNLSTLLFYTPNTIYYKLLLMGFALSIHYICIYIYKLPKHSAQVTCRVKQAYTGMHVYSRRSFISGPYLYNVCVRYVD